MAARIDDVLAIDDVDLVDVAGHHIIVDAHGAHISGIENRHLHFLWNVNLLMVSNLNSCRAQVILRFAFAY
jgi:hypothetical protein